MLRCSWGWGSSSWRSGRGGSRKSRLSVVLLALFLLAQRPDVQRRAIVYTTAESTSFRLTPADTLTFKTSAPTSDGTAENYVTPRKTFQPLIGVAGALRVVAGDTLG